MEKLDLAFQKLGAAVLWQKAAGLSVFVALLIGGYWFFFLDDIWTQRAQMTAEQAKLVAEKREYEQRKVEYLAFRKEVAQLLEEQRDVLRLLPKKDDIEQFVEALQQQIELSGITKTTLVRDPALAQDLYIRLPVKMTVYGTYHQLLRFFKSMVEIPRIVNVEDLNLGMQTSEKELPPDTLKADFVVVAFQYLDKPAPKAGATGSADAGMKSVAQSSGGGK